MQILKFLKIYKYLAVTALVFIVELLFFLFKLLNRIVVPPQSEATTTAQRPDEEGTEEWKKGQCRKDTNMLEDLI